MNEIFLNEPIARGRTAEVYDWDDGHILKLFHNWFDRQSIEYELKIARAVHASGVRMPAACELLQVQGRNGLIYERAAGESMLAMFKRKPWKLVSYARMLAQLHAQMHECVFQADVPAQYSRLQNKINDAQALSSSLKTSLLNALRSMPDGDRVCHGDFHPDNVLVSGQESTVIDWIDASRGNPLADVARTSIILAGAAASTQISNPLLKLFVRLFHSAYLKHYFRLHPGGKHEYRRWVPIAAGARLSENIPALEKWLVKQASLLRKPRKNG